jgi:flagellar biogenesis protein FliO
MRSWYLWVSVFFALIARPAIALDVPSSVAPRAQIPFNVSATPLEQHGSHEILIIGLFLLIAACVIYVIRKKRSLFELPPARIKRLKIIERTRLNPKSTLYVVEFDQRTILIGQCADNLVCLVDTGKTASESDKANG